MSTKKKAASAAGAALSRLGASKGGLARAAKLSAERRSEIARTAIRRRWAKNDNARRDEKPAVEYGPPSRGKDGRLSKCERLLRDACQLLEDLASDATGGRADRSGYAAAGELVTEAIAKLGSER